MDKQCITIWPEETPPNGVENCTDCGLFTHGSRLIWGEGNPHAPIICGTRETLQKAAYEAGFHDKDLYVTYVLKRRPIRAYDKSVAREACMQHLLAQLESKSPQFVFCLGNVATQTFFADKEAEVKNLRQEWHSPRGGKTAVSYHPLAVRRRPNLWLNFIADWRFLAVTYYENHN